MPMKKLIGKLRQLHRSLTETGKVTASRQSRTEHYTFYRKLHGIAAVKHDAMVNRLTNWQRNQWAKAGYPGGHGANKDEKLIEPFTSLKKARNP